jgi:hypothetical protein
MVLSMQLNVNLSKKAGRQLEGALSVSLIQRLAPGTPNSVHHATSS